MAKNGNLSKAKEVKNDSFYTIIDDIISEIAQHPDYVRQFEGKTVFMNCDDPEWSNFVEFFRKFFKKLKLKKMISTHYNSDGSPSYKLEWSGEKINGDTVNMIKTPLKGNGDFASEECIEILKESDFLVTNPPFSLFRKYVDLLMRYEKKFLIIGNKNAITYKEFFPLMKDEKVWIGYNAGHGTMQFATEIMENGAVGPATNSVPAYWYTNLDIDKIHEPLILTKNYKGNEEKYPRYDNYDAINVDKVADIPKDYFGVMGVPITYMAQHCQEQFEIVGMDGQECSPACKVYSHKEKVVDGARSKSLSGTLGCVIREDSFGKGTYFDVGYPVRALYKRIFIRRKQEVKE